MSLIRIAARMAAVQALKGRTLVGDNVLDSRIGALDVQADGTARTDQEKPFISVYCDASSLVKTADRRIAVVNGLELRALVPNGLTDFLFEAGISAAMVETDTETDESVVFEGIPATDAAFEFKLDLIMRQIGDALTDPANTWADIFRSLCLSFRSVERARATGDDRTRLAAHQLRLEVELIVDPVKGADLKPEHALARFFAAALALGDSSIAAQVALMQAQIAGDEHQWQMAMRRYGLALAEAREMLLTPPLPAEASSPDISIVTARLES